MHASLLRAAKVLCTLTLLCSMANVGQAQTTTNIVAAAETFLAALSEKQRDSVLLAFDDDKQRVRWSNFPIAMARRGGLSLQEMNAAQRSAALTLVSSALSRRGFEKIQQIVTRGLLGADPPMAL